jgi:Tol biopolymer transport system component
MPRRRLVLALSALTFAAAVLLAIALAAALGLVVVVLLAACAGGDDASEQLSPPPGEELIAFSSNRDGDFELYVMRPDGSGLRQLTHNEERGANQARDESPSWSPDGKRIAFVSTRDHPGNPLSSYEIYVIDADGRNERRLTANRLGEFGPAWTNDGRIVFAACGRDLRTCRLESSRPDGSDRTRFGALPARVILFGTALSPDGSHVAFARPERGNVWAWRNTDLYVAELDGSDQRQLTDNPANDDGAVWSPDGSKILFTSDRDRNGDCLFHDCIGHAPELYVMDAEGSDEERLTRSPATEAGPTWSPDGTRIIFSRIADEEDDHDLYLANADGSCMRRITADPEWDWMPSWTGSGGKALEC